MKELQTVENLIGILRNDKILADRYLRDIQWLQERAENWKQNLIRVGVIGVTSSGKSTLINALLGEVILPTAVRPSSGRLVTCVKDKTKKATIYFENKLSPIILEKEKLTLKEISGYADEDKNPNNIKKVRHIELASPKFALQGNIMLIDSPGLDAYGLENHEKLTLEILLPTIDCCIFVTTLKANSDATTLRVLNAIEEHKKPIIIIQNMLDSVEPKIGLNGAVIKTKEEVAKEHIDRVKKIVDKSSIKDKSIVSIIQVSSKIGLDGRVRDDKKLIKASKLDNLIEEIERKIELLLPQIENQRYLQIKKYLEELVENEKAYCSRTESAKVQFKTEDYIQLSNKLTKDYNHSKDYINQAVSSIISLADNANRCIDALGEKDIDKCSKIVDDVKSETTKTENNILEKIKKTNQEFTKVFKELNLVAADYYYEKPYVAGSNSLTVKKKLIETERKVKKSGIGGSVARGFGKLFRNDDWGYEYVWDTKEVLDKTATKNMITKLCSTTASEYEKSIKGWQDRSTQLLSAVQTEVQRRKKDFEEKQKIIVQTDKVKKIIVQLSNEVTKLNMSLGKETTPISNLTKNVVIDKGKIEAAAAKDVKNYFEFPIKNHTAAALKLANTMVNNIFSLTCNTCKKKNETIIGGLDYTVIWGWDQSCMESFSQRFLGLEINYKEQETLISRGVLYKDKYIFVNEGGFEKRNSNEEIISAAKKINDNKSNIFILTNAIQQGAAAKQVAGSYLKYLKSNNCIVNWVVQSLNEFVVDNSVEQAVESLMYIKDKLPGVKSGFMLFNHSNPLYSMVMVELQTRENVTVSDESDILRILNSKFGFMFTGRDYDNITKMIRAYTKKN